MKYYIRTGEGEQLDVPDGSHVVMLFRQKFLSPEDEIRKEGSDRWRKLKDIPEYASMLRYEASDTARFKRIFLVTAMLACLGIIAAVLFG